MVVSLAPTSAKSSWQRCRTRCWLSMSTTTRSSTFSSPRALTLGLIASSSTTSTSRMTLTSEGSSRCQIYLVPLLSLQITISESLNFFVLFWNYSWIFVVFNKPSSDLYFGRLQHASTRYDLQQFHQCTPSGKHWLRTKSCFFQFLLHL